MLRLSDMLRGLLPERSFSRTQGCGDNRRKMPANDPSETQSSLIIGSAVDQDTSDSFTIQQLSVFGLGKLGLPLAALFAQSGLRTVGIDVDIALVEKLRTGKIPLLEPGLEALMAAAAPKINYTTDARAADDTDASIIVVSTPYDYSRAASSSTSVEEACGELCAALRQRTPWRYHLVDYLLDRPAGRDLNENRSGARRRARAARGRRIRDSLCSGIRGPGRCGIRSAKTTVPADWQRRCRRGR